MEITELGADSSVNTREPLSKSSAVGALKLNFGEDVRLSPFGSLGFFTSCASAAKFGALY
jgi:hypothetical protein